MVSWNESNVREEKGGGGGGGGKKKETTETLAVSRREVNGFADFHAIEDRSRSYRSGIWPDDCRFILVWTARGQDRYTGMRYRACKLFAA